MNGDTDGDDKRDGTEELVAHSGVRSNVKRKISDAMSRRTVDSYNPENKKSWFEKTLSKHIPSTYASTSSIPTTKALTKQLNLEDRDYLFEVELDDLNTAELAARFFDTKQGVVRRTQKHRFRSYSDAFTGTAAVDWLVENVELCQQDRAKALQVGNKLFHDGHFHHVTKNFPLKDKHVLYVPSEKPQIHASNDDLWDIIEPALSDRISMDAFEQSVMDDILEPKKVEKEVKKALTVQCELPEDRLTKKDFDLILKLMDCKNLCNFTASDLNTISDAALKLFLSFFMGLVQEVGKTQCRGNDPEFVQLLNAFITRIGNNRFVRTKFLFLALQEPASKYWQVQMDFYRELENKVEEEEELQELQELEELDLRSETDDSYTSSEESEEEKEVKQQEKGKEIEKSNEKEEELEKQSEEKRRVCFKSEILAKKKKRRSSSLKKNADRMKSKIQKKVLLGQQRKVPDRALRASVGGIYFKKIEKKSPAIDKKRDEDDNSDEKNGTKHKFVYREKLESDLGETKAETSEDNDTSGDNTQSSETERKTWGEQHKKPRSKTAIEAESGSDSANQAEGISTHKNQTNIKASHLDARSRADKREVVSVCVNVSVDAVDIQTLEFWKEVFPKREFIGGEKLTARISHTLNFKEAESFKHEITRVKVEKIFSSIAQPALVSLHHLPEGAPIIDSSFEEVFPKVIFKTGDNLCNDMSCQIVFRLFNILWRTSGKFAEGDCPFILSYQIVPTNPKEGFMETIGGVTPFKNFNWEVWAENSSDEVQRNMINSAAGSFIGGYILGVRDRHWDNILVQNDCTIFNIDFGYLLGAQPPIDAPKFALSQNMNQVLVQKGLWNDFLDKCTTAFQVLRDNCASVMHSVSLVFEQAGMDPIVVQKYLGSQSCLMLQLDNAKSKEAIIKQIETSPRSWTNLFKQYSHGSVDVVYYKLLKAHFPLAVFAQSLVEKHDRKVENKRQRGKQNTENSGKEPKREEQASHTGASLSLLTISQKHPPSSSFAP